LPEEINKDFETSTEEIDQDVVEEESHPVTPAIFTKNLKQTIRIKVGDQLRYNLPRLSENMQIDVDISEESSDLLTYGKRQKRLSLKRETTEELDANREIKTIVRLTDVSLLTQNEYTILLFIDSNVPMEVVSPSSRDDETDKD